MLKFPFCKTKKDRTKQIVFNRQGAVTVEFACTAGVAILFLFAMLEYGRVSMIRQSVELAVYEGGRKGIVAGATSREVIEEARRVLAISRVVGAEINASPSNITDRTPAITVTISVPLDQGLFGPVKFFGGKRLERSLTLRREGR